MQSQQTSQLEKELDSLIYELYGLSGEEIALIESEFNSKERERLAIIDNLYRLVRESSFEGKIIFPCIQAKEPCFVYEERGFYAPAPANIITGSQSIMKYLTGLLNSKFVYFFARKFYMGGGIEGEFKTNNIEKLPIPQITQENKGIAYKIIELVEILSNVRGDSKFLESSVLESRDVSGIRPQHDVPRHSDNFFRHSEHSEESLNHNKESLQTNDFKKALESKIDSLVYKLYNLTDEEIELIEKD